MIHYIHKTCVLYSKNHIVYLSSICLTSPQCNVQYQMHRQFHFHLIYTLNDPVSNAVISSWPVIYHKALENFLKQQNNKLSIGKTTTTTEKLNYMYISTQFLFCNALLCCMSIQNVLYVCT